MSSGILVLAQIPRHLPRGSCSKHGPAHGASRGSTVTPFCWLEVGSHAALLRRSRATARFRYLAHELASLPLDLRVQDQDIGHVPPAVLFGLSALPTFGGWVLAGRADEARLDGGLRLGCG